MKINSTKLVLFLIAVSIGGSSSFIPSTQGSLLSPFRDQESKLLYVENNGENKSLETPKCDQSIIDQITTERPYGLFVTEKVAEFVENSIPHHPQKSSSNDDMVEEGNVVEMKKKTKEKVVVLGSGWGATAFLKNIDTDPYDVTVVSPRNYFLFTPMLAGATVGTVEYRSITEPIREINNKVSYLEANAGCIDIKEKSVVILPVECDGNQCGGIQEQDEIPYDRLIYTVGARTNTFGIPGVTEYCNFLKQVGDARKIRAALVNCFERASFPHLTDEERERYLTFAVIGAGPSGIEFAAELRDFIQEDGPKYYPKLLKYVRIKVIEASSTVLAPFHKTLQQEAIQRLTQSVEATKSNGQTLQKLLPPDFKLIQLMLDSSVKEVTEEKIFLNDGSTINYGLAVWAAGNAPLPLTLDLIEDLGQVQGNEQKVARGRIAVDPWLRVIGSNDGSIFALGDASCLVHNQVPATGQVAAQQGEYLARLMNKQYNLSKINEKGTLCPPSRVAHGTTPLSISDSIASLSTKTTDYAKPFQFLNLGILAYTGDDTALAQVPATGPNREPLMATGKIGSELWKSVYLWKQVSWRNRLMVASDWMKRKVFGRDISHFD